MSPAVHKMFVISILGTLLLAQTYMTSPIIDSQPPQVLRYDLETAQMPYSYKFHYDASDGSSRSEQGSVLNPNAALDVFGTVRYYDKKGQLYEMSYKAGKRGYRTIIKKVS